MGTVISVFLLVGGNGPFDSRVPSTHLDAIKWVWSWVRAPTHARHPSNLSLQALTTYRRRLWQHATAGFAAHTS